MENFVVSARKYRPITFDTVVGQKSITSTLKNAIKNHHLAQAFLFCGPRGVGKTTCARILAKTINCENKTENIEACDQCESCVSFNNAASFNIHELDAASNNSVEDIRNLVDQVRIPPQVGKFKVYIIDEVHMLSSAAFNAFLKTLEEPPAYAKFILATTEKHKIIPTILSRCQIYDFKRIVIDDIAKHLEFVAQSEQVTAESDALHIIAQKADGALRDALSIFDQIVSFSGGNITYKNVIENLNVLDYDYYFKLVDFILKGDITQSLLIINEIIENGFDGQHFIIGMGEHLRNLLVCKDSATVKLLEVGESIRNKYLEQSGNCGLKLLLTALEINNKTDISYKSSNNKRLHIELAIMQMCSINTSPDQNKEPQPTVVSQKKTEVKTETKVQIAEPKEEQKTEPIVSSPPVQNEPPNTIKENQVDAVVESPLKEEPKAVSNGNGVKSFKGTGTFSIKNFTKEQEKKEEEVLSENETRKNLPSTEFSQDTLLKFWEQFLSSIEKENPSFANALRKYPPVKKNNYIIEFTTDNKLVANDTTMLNELQGYLKRSLNNYKLSLKAVVSQVQVNTTAYTDKEKYEKLASKNPNLIKLKEGLDLEIEF